MEESEGKDRWTRAKVLPSSGHSNLLELISIETHTRKDCLQLTENQYGFKVKFEYFKGQVVKFFP